MRTRFLLALSFAAALTLAPGARAQQNAGESPTPQPPPPPMPTGEKLVGFGRLDGSVYTNTYFDITFTAPAGWKVIDPEVMKLAAERAKAVFKDETDPELKRQLEESVDRVTPLYSASKMAAGAPAGFNATLICAAERIPSAVVKTPREFYTTLLHSMKLSQGVDVEVIEPFSERRVGTTAFGLYTLKMTSNMGVIMQKQLIAVRGPYAYGLIFSYSDEADAKAFEQVVRTLKSR